MPWLTATHAVHFAAAAARLGVRVPLPAALRDLGRSITHEDRVEAAEMLDYLQAVTARSGRRGFPLLAALWATEVQSPIVHLAGALPTVADGVAATVRYLALVTDLYRPVLRGGPDEPEHRFWLEPTADAPRHPGLHHALEFEVGSLWAGVKLLYPEALPWVEVEIPASDAPAAEYASLLGCPVRTGARAVAIVFRAETLAIRTRRPNELLGRFLQAHLDRRLDEVRLHPQVTATERVRTHLMTSLPHHATARTCARALGWSERTLHRRLSAEATSFRTVLDGVRRELAAAWLPYEPVDVVAERLGYADGTSFARAFRRWHGHSPARRAAALAGS